MSILRNRTATAAIVAVAAGALTLTACGGGDGGSSAKDNSKKKEDAKSQSKPVQIGDAQASTGPAPEVPGAKPGGVATVYQEADFSHLDPGQIYVSDGKLLSRLIFRGLTQYDEDEQRQPDRRGRPRHRRRQGVRRRQDLDVHPQGQPEGRERQPDHTLARTSATRSSASTPTTSPHGPTYLQQWLSGDGTTYRDAYAGRSRTPSGTRSPTRCATSTSTGSTSR
ncbi:ABC transporter substrate-binding protein OS=Streptomyces tendae OX=1932 GN=GUR47_15295 PE=4 SV=1 [Streptomyces tendae]